MLKLCLVGLVAVVLTGCITKHAGVDGCAAAWTEGVTTRGEVVRKWGNPDKSRGNVWIWRDWNLIGSKFKCSYYHIGFTLASSRVSTCEYHLTFNDCGVLESVNTVESVPGGAEWTWNPFL